MLFAKVLRSPHAHARIVAIDDSGGGAARRARRPPPRQHRPRQVRLRRAELAEPTPVGPGELRRQGPPRGRPGRRRGGGDAEIAEEACRLIKVTYEELPAVFDELEAMMPARRSSTTRPDTGGDLRPVPQHQPPHRGPDRLRRGTWRRRSRGRSASSRRPSTSSRSSTRPSSPTSRSAGSTRTSGWCSAPPPRCPFHVRRMVAQLLRACRSSAIRVIKPRIGGGFGAKQEMLIEDIVGHLVLATRRPVRLELTRAEEFISSRTRHADDGHASAPASTPRAGSSPRTCRGLQHRRLRHPRVHGALGCGPARPVALQLPRQALPLRRRLHEPPRGRRLPRLRRNPGVLRPRVPHGRHRRVPSASTPSSSARELGPHRRRPRHRAAARRGRWRRGHRPRGPPRHHELRPRGVRRCRAGRHRLGRRRRPPGTGPRPAAHPPGHRHGARHAGLGDPARGHGRPARSRSTTTVRSTCSWARPTSAPARTPCSPRSPPRCSACRSRTSSSTRPTPTSRRSTSAPTPSSTTYISGDGGRRRPPRRPGRGSSPGRRRLLGVDDPRRSSCTTAGPGRSTAARCRLEDIALNALHTEDQEQIMGTAIARLARVARRPSRPSSPRSRWTSRPARSR